MDKKTKDIICRLGHEMRARRESQNISQTQLALMIGTGQSYLSRVETGKIAVGIDKLIKIAEALDTDLKSLVDF